MNLGQMLAQTAAQTPDKTAIIFHDQRTSYRDFDERANQVANGLIQLGVQPGDRVALYIHNLPIFMEAYYGILKAGASVVPLNVLYKAGEVEYILQDSGAKAILTFTLFAPVALAAATNAPELRHVIVAAPEEMPGATLWRNAFGDAATSAPAVAVQDEDVAVICYTSGTTGRPKGAMLTHRNLISNLNQCSAIESISTRPDDIVWLALPLFHIYAMNVAMNLAVKNGATLDLVERFDLTGSLEELQKNHCTVLYGAPPMFVGWAQVPTLKDYDLSSVRYIASGAAALPGAHHGAIRGAGGRAHQRGLWSHRGVARRHQQRRRTRHQARHRRASHPRLRGQNRR